MNMCSPAVSVTLKKIMQLLALLYCYNYICLYFSRIAMLSHYKVEHQRIDAFEVWC